MADKDKEKNSKPKDTSVTVAWIGAGATIIAALIGIFALWVQPQIDEEKMPTSTVVIPTNTISPIQTPIYSMQSGTLDIPPSSSARSFFGSGIIKKNFMAKVTFHAPYSADKGIWDAGFTFGDSVRVVVVSSGKWGFNKPSLSLINLPASLALQEGEPNSLSLTVYEGSGCFFVNNQFVADLDLSALDTNGEIKLMTSYIVGSSLENETATLRFSNFEIYSVDTLKCD